MLPLEQPDRIQIAFDDRSMALCCVGLSVGTARQPAWVCPEFPRLVSRFSRLWDI